MSALGLAIFATGEFCFFDMETKTVAVCQSILFLKTNVQDSQKERRIDLES